MDEHEHEQDREFLKELKSLSLEELKICLQNPECEFWRRIAITRAIFKKIQEQVQRETKT